MRQAWRISARPRVLAAIMGACVLAVLLASVIPVSLAGEAVIVRRQRLVATTARDYFVAFAQERGFSNMAEALDRRTRLEVSAFSYAAFDATGRLLGGQALAPYARLLGPGFHTIGIDGQDYEVLVQPFTDGRSIVIFEDLTARREFQKAIFTSVFAALVTGLVLVAGVGIWLQRLMVARADGLARAAERIAAGDLSARAPVGHGADVFDELAGSVNGMLARIETLMADLRLVTDSLAHDLRLPLARLRAAAARSADPEQPEAVRVSEAERVLQLTDDIGATLTTLLDVARAEAGLSRESMAPVDMIGLVEEMAELFGPVMEDAGQTLHVDLPDQPLHIVGHGLFLRQALGNLLHNASRFGGAGGRVRVGLEALQGGARLVVSDQGPGIPEAMREKVLQRFVRLDEARATPGSGLGLTIVAACAKLHGGRVVLEDAAPGLRVVLDLATGDT